MWGGAHFCRYPVSIDSNRTAGDSKCQELGEEGEREGKINQNHRNVNTTETLQAHLRGKKKKWRNKCAQDLFGGNGE